MKARFLAVRERSYKGKGETKASPAVLGWNHRYEYKQTEWQRTVRVDVSVSMHNFIALSARSSDSLITISIPKTIGF